MRFLLSRCVECLWHTLLCSSHSHVHKVCHAQQIRDQGSDFHHHLHLVLPYHVGSTTAIKAPNLYSLPSPSVIQNTWTNGKSRSRLCICARGLIVMEEKKLKEWNTALFDCFEDASTCCYGFWCGPCLACTVSGRFGEAYCLPVCDVMTSASQFVGVPVCVPPVAVSMRAAMRNRYGIKGSIAGDIVASCCCTWCSWCQMHRELKHQRKAPVVINMQQQQVIHMQPNLQPMMMMPTVPMAPMYMSQPQTIMTSN
ncbi:protein PLANT CADMIUM RESISTANCE 11 isoform X2 [Oryzias melastigma]|uniref:Protein PLANT CADMIUM RESISTANCE 11-like n=1 Tax=Oryzias melastigma TaxID=30732 RepID=A0A3B3D6X4_ORYME|nr:protein PLANT CADMIUM RESISTANCE 11 isoform X2 [Oryzias melastigma]